MKRRKRISILIFLVIATTAFTHKKVKILIIGDSISIGYTPFVQKDLENIAEVMHNPGNGKHTGNGLKKMKDWIGDTDWDIIQFNWGLWDLCYRHPDSKVQGKRDKVNGSITYTIEEYEQNLDALIKLMKEKSDAQLIFVTTTYVPENEAGRHAQDAITYNEVARKIMEANGVAINDIYKKSISIHNKYGKGNDDVHYSKQGYAKLGKQITRFLKKRRYLRKRNTQI